MNDTNWGIVRSLAETARSGGTDLIDFLMAHQTGVFFSGLLASKAVRQSISRLVLGCAEIPEEWLKNRRKMIELKGEVERQPIKVFAEQAGKAISESQLVKDRAELFALNTLEKKQIIRESIAQKTMEHLEGEDLSEDVSPPSEDFMWSFLAVAEKASSEELQDMMARILAGEIRQSGSISRATLSIADILDKNIIEAMLFIKPYLIENEWVCVDTLDHQIFWDKCQLLSSIGITTEPGARTYGFNPQGNAIMSFAGGAIFLECKDKERAISQFAPITDGFNLTRSGKELMSLLPKESKGSIENIAEKYREKEYFSKVVCGNIVEENGKMMFVPS